MEASFNKPSSLLLYIHKLLIIYSVLKGSCYCKNALIVPLYLCFLTTQLLYICPPSTIQTASLQPKILTISEYCTISTKCSVTGHKWLWIEHFRCFVMGWFLRNFGPFWPILLTNEQFWCLSWPKFGSWTPSGSVHKHHTSHPMNSWLKWYSTCRSLPRVIPAPIWVFLKPCCIVIVIITNKILQIWWFPTCICYKVVQELSIYNLSDL
jgi:hypothetical protein